jgi:hypothetical protein
LSENDKAAGQPKPWYMRLIEFPLVALVIAIAVVIGTL